jgi:hypothetical protein
MLDITASSAELLIANVAPFIALSFPSHTFAAMPSAAPIVH